VVGSCRGAAFVGIEAVERSRLEAVAAIVREDGTDSAEDCADRPVLARSSSIATKAHLMARETGRDSEDGDTPRLAPESAPVRFGDSRH